MGYQPSGGHTQTSTISYRLNSDAKIVSRGRKNDEWFKNTATMAPNGNESAERIRRRIFEVVYFSFYQLSNSSG